MTKYIVYYMTLLAIVVGWAASVLGAPWPVTLGLASVVGCVAVALDEKARSGRY